MSLAVSLYQVGGIISGLNAMVIDQAERAGKHRVVAQYMLESLNTHNIWTIKIFIVEIIYLLNAVANIYLIDVLLGARAI